MGALPSGSSPSVQQGSRPLSSWAPVPRLSPGCQPFNPAPVPLGQAGPASGWSWSSVWDSHMRVSPALRGAGRGHRAESGRGVSGTQPSRAPRPPGPAAPGGHAVEPPARPCGASARRPAPRRPACAGNTPWRPSSAAGAAFRISVGAGFLPTPSACLPRGDVSCAHGSDGCRPANEMSQLLEGLGQELQHTHARHPDTPATGPTCLGRAGGGAGSSVSPGTATFGDTLEHGPVATPHKLKARSRCSLCGTVQAAHPLPCHQDTCHT